MRDLTRPAARPALGRLALVLAAALAGGCAGRGVGRDPIPALPYDGFVVDSGAVNPWTDLVPENDPDPFQFVIMADRTGEAREGVFEDAVRKVNLLGPEFVVCIGDLIEGKEEDAAEIDHEWTEFLEILRPLRMPFFFVPGNHDISNDLAARKWDAHFGRSFYHFVYRRALFLVLNTERMSAGTISDDQVAYVRKVLAANPKVRWTCVFMHKPLWLSRDQTGWETVEALLKGRPYSVFAGHDHVYTKYVRGGRTCIKFATTGGVSALEGPEDGTFDQVAWVTLTDEGPRIANLALDGIFDEDLVTEQTGPLAAAVARAFASDPLLVEGDAFDARTVRLTLANAADFPMKVRAAFGPNPHLVPAPDVIERTVRPKAAETVDVQLVPAGSVPPDAIAPLGLAWTVTCDVPGQRPFQRQGTHWMLVERVRPCPPAPRAVTVDGRLEEWGDLPNLCREPAEVRRDPKTWSGPADGRFRFAVAHDDACLYLAVEVTDDVLVLDPRKAVWDQDGIEVRLDARPEPERSAGRGTGEFQDILLAALSPAAEGGERVCYGRDRLPEGTRVACVRTGTGYAAEIAIPSAYLDAKQGKAWEAFRLNVAVDDFDGPEDRGSQLWWRPDWRHDKNYAGSGTFRRR
jgi:hypothetical protein